jgi:diaminohydroxyphosphoribosylaminopyrimidine deaminase/5-amino-6-(5-phosphoribosylamino)uracil reductase
VVTRKDLRFMRRALEQARRGLGRTTPNPIVGACIVTDEGVVVGDGAHEKAGDAHAEINAINEAGERTRGATLYCTLEPCSHSGKTGPCTDAIIAAGIKRVVAAMQDPFPLVSGRGFAALRAHGIDVEEGVERDAALRLNQPFLTAVRDGRPFVIVKAATSIDGRIAAGPGQRTQLTSAAAQRHAQYVRAEVDAIGIGSETLLVDDPLLTVRDVYRARPLMRVIFDRRRRTPPTARIFSTSEAGPVKVVGASGQSMLSMLRELASEGIQSLLLEGGAAIHQAAWDEGVVDYVQLYVAPTALGAAGVPLFNGRPWSMSSLIEPKLELLGPDTLIEGYVHRPR